MRARAGRLDEPHVALLDEGAGGAGGREEHDLVTMAGTGRGRQVDRVDLTPTDLEVMRKDENLQGTIRPRRRRSKSRHRWGNAGGSVPAADLTRTAPAPTQ